MKLALVDDVIILLYFVFVLSIGFFAKKKIKTSQDFLLSGRAIPLWISSLAFISANLGAQEVIGMAASGAKYGMMTAHFYWLGAVPAMVFLGIFMMPFYYGSKARSVPEYLYLRFDNKTRTLNALSFAAMTVFSSGISLYGLAILLQSILGWEFDFSIWVSAGIVMAYIFVGGLTSAIYNEVLQFFLIVLGLAPLVFAGLYKVGGWNNFLHSVPPVLTHAWSYSFKATQNPMGVHALGLVMGLGFVLSFGYWCTDFLVVQRAMVARNISSAEKTPLVAAFPKMFLPFVVILPGLLAFALANHFPDFALPLKADGRIDYDMTLPHLLRLLLPSGLLGVGVTALLASFMSGMAGNVTAFNSVWTYDIYQAYFNKNASDRHYLTVARVSTVVGILVSVAAAYLTRSFNNIMDLLQLVFGFVNAPLFATFLLGMFWKRTTSHGAFYGLLSGTAAGALFHGFTLAERKGGWLTSHPMVFNSGMSQAFGVAIAAFTTCFLVTLILSLLSQGKTDEELRGLVYSLESLEEREKPSRWFQTPVALGCLVATILVVLNYIWW